MAANTTKKLGVWAFIFGVILALIVGLLAANLTAYMGLISALMVLLGLIVGILNITEEEVNSFIIAAIGLATGSIAIANLGTLLPGTVGVMLKNTFSVFSVFVAGAVFIPALKSVYRISRD
ncbi:MAG TPA: hypothetical protein VFF28_02465 [Candidatus Nanoarchaeia archaeon]|nr:hypothetical protein [Candidatus Nanoarchaeia archaeon]